MSNNSKKTYAVANWKMNGSFANSKALLSGIKQFVSQNESDIAAEIILCPASLYVDFAVKETSDLRPKISIGGQNCSSHSSGAYTGEISADMLKDVGAEYVILGHSERRQLFADSSDDVREKAERAIAAHLQPIICVGENLAEYESGQTIEVIETQVLQSLPSGLPPSELPSDIIIAYEPVWAIGSGKIPSVKEIDNVHKAIINILNVK